MRRNIEDLGGLPGHTWEESEKRMIFGREKGA